MVAALKRGIRFRETGAMSEYRREEARDAAVMTSVPPRGDGRCPAARTPLASPGGIAYRSRPASPAPLLSRATMPSSQG